MTGVNQINAKYREQSMDYLETDLVEVTAHLGARNIQGPHGWEAHTVWQGRVFRWRRDKEESDKDGGSRITAGENPTHSKSDHARWGNFEEAESLARSTHVSYNSDRTAQTIEYLARNKDVFGCRVIHLPKAEYAHVMHELETWMTPEDRKKRKLPRGDKHERLFKKGI